MAEQKPGSMTSLAGGFSYSESCFAGSFESTPVVFNSNAGGMSMEMVGFMSKNLQDYAAPPWSHHQGLDDPSMGCVMFSDGRNGNPNQGLSLSLSSSNPSFRHCDAPSSSGFVALHPPPQIVPERTTLRDSKYLVPAQDLLNQFCGLRPENTPKLKPKIQVPEEDAIKKQSLYSLDLLELERRRKKLLQMLDEVERRYRHYCNQMRTVVMSFEAVAGDGSAAVYSAMASKAMSRHFRRLRDGIMSQIVATKRAIGEQDVAAPGTTKGDTPRLRLVDQTLRQQKALHQTSFMESHPWRPQRGLPERAVTILRAWLFEHFLNPYPCDVDKHILARQTGLSKSQVSNWFINARVRLWKPMVEEIYLEELKESEAMTSNDTTIEDPRDSEYLSSIINTHKKRKGVGAEGGPPPEFLDSLSVDGHTGFRLTLGTGAGDNPSMFFGREETQMGDCQNYSLLESENQKPPYRDLMGAQLLHDLAGLKSL